MEHTITKPSVHFSSIPDKMLTAQLSEPGKFTVKKQKVELPETDEILVRMEGCGLCASSLPVWEGRDWFKYPREVGAPGHEGYGTVVKTGEAVNDFQIGDRVAMISNKAYAAYEAVPASAAVKIPMDLYNYEFPGEAVGCAFNIFRRSKVMAGDTVAIVGIGFLGALLTQLIKGAGAKVIAISRRDYSLHIAKEMGADSCIPMDDHHRIIEKVKTWTDGKFCDKVIECTGVEWPLNLAGELCAVRGRLIIAGFHQGGMRQLNIQLWNWRGLDVINAHERDTAEYVRGMKDALAALKNGRIDLRSLITHQFALDEINEAFETLKNRPAGFIKAIIKFNKDDQ